MLFNLLMPDDLQIINKMYIRIVYLKTIVAWLTRDISSSLLLESNTNWNFFWHF